MSQRLPLHEEHVRAGAHLGVFGAWEVPLYFTSILKEHQAVRERAGLFDISHMGEIEIEGPRAGEFLQGLVSRNVQRLENGKAMYSLLLNERGGIVDDIIIYQLAGGKFLLIVNASNIEKDFQWIRSHASEGVRCTNVSDEKVLFALQGPKSLKIAGRLFNCDFKTVRYYHFRTVETRRETVWVSRTGYTGEDGVEIMAGVSGAAELWNSIREAGKSEGLELAGFGARDTLRLEAGMLLYGQDMNDGTSPLEAGLDWTLDLEKGDFTGRQALLEQEQKGLTRKLAGFEMKDKGIPRHGFTVKKAGRMIGEVTSGGVAPALGKNIGLAYVENPEARLGNEIEIQIREQSAAAKVTALPFYKRRKE